jgi:hypothetical protein
MQLRHRTVTPPAFPNNVPLLEAADLPLDEDWSLLGCLPRDDDDFEISFSPDVD